MNTVTDQPTLGRRRAHPQALTRTLPRFSRGAGFWAVAFSFLVLTAFSTAPSALYGLYEQQQQLSSLTITVVYAVYAVGVVASLLLAGHVSDWYGRRAVLIPALVLAGVAALVFIAWQSLAGLLVARVLTGVALGATVATATAYIADLDTGPDGAPSRRSGIVATISNIGGLALGPLIAGVLAQYAPAGLTLPYVVLLAALIVATVAVAVSPEGHRPVHPRPSYRPQRLRAPAQARSQFVAATTGAFLVFAVGGLFAGLAGTFLAGPLDHPSAALTGFAILLNFGAGVLVQITTTRWPAPRLIVVGLAPMLVGLVVLVASAWTSPASLTLFLVGGAVVGAGGGAILRGSLTVVISTAGAADRAGALATFFTAAYVGLALPVLGLGIALQFLTPRVTLLIFAVAVGFGVLAAAPSLVRQPAGTDRARRGHAPVAVRVTRRAPKTGASARDSTGATPAGQRDSDLNPTPRRIPMRPDAPGDPVAIVTGGSCAIGREVVRRLASRGYAIVVVYLDDQSRAEAAVEEILAADGTAVAVRADLTDDLDVERVFTEAVAAFAGVHVLVHTTVRGASVLYRHAARHLRRGSAIVSVSTAEQITPVLAERLRERDITVNGVPPGLEPPGADHEVADLITLLDRWRHRPAG